MQTFLPYANASLSAGVLDRQRLGKQRVEAYQILNALTGKSKGWVNHPATRMWRGYERALAFYGWVMCDEWIRRGYRDSLQEKFLSTSDEEFKWPDWYGDERIHLSHRSNLVRKYPDFYRVYWPDVRDDLPYVWPVS